MRRGIVLGCVVGMLTACSPNHGLPPEQNSLAKRIEPQPGRSLIYVHGDASIGKRGVGLVLFAKVDEPVAPAKGLAEETASPATAKLKIFNTTFTLIDAPEGVIRLVAEMPATAEAGVTGMASAPFTLQIEPGKKYYVLVTPPNAGAGSASVPKFVVEGATEGVQAIAPAQLGGYVRFAKPGEKPSAATTAQQAKCIAPCS